MKTFSSAWILGLGVSGRAAANLLLAEGTDIVLFDKTDTATLRAAVNNLEARGARLCLGEEAGTQYIRHTLASQRPDVCVVSPGIPSDSPWVRDISAAGVPIISELELGARRMTCPMLAITGSKGKSTLAKLCYDSLRAAGHRVALGGNYGTPLCELASRGENFDWAVVEVSSFQLEHVDSFSPRVGVLLNIQPDHLDRHGTMEAYAATKAKLFANMTITDTAVIHAPDAALHFSSGRQATTITFGLSDDAQYRFTNGHIVGPDSNVIVTISGSYFDNPVLGKTAAAAAAALAACNVRPVFLESAIQTFEPLPHRMSQIAVIDGVTYINDSKATSLTALAAGVEMCKGRVRLLAGGLLKETDLSRPKQILANRVCGVYVFGKFAGRLKDAWQDVVPCRMCQTLEEATRAAAGDACAGEVVLLSPGCASFDQFRNFEDRGDQFIQIVRTLKKRDERNT